MLKFIDPSHPFYRPLWRRALIVVFCFAWAGLELWNDAQIWAAVAAALGAYAAYALILTYDPDAADRDQGTRP